MARPPAAIPKKAAEAWTAGDEPLAEKLSGLKSRQLRNRLGPPGRGKAPPAASEPAEATAATQAPQKLVQVARGATARPSPAPAPPDPPPPPPSDPEPTLEQIGALDTRAEAEAIYRDIRSKMPDADPVRFASLAEKALAAINRLEQIDARRPKPPPRDAVVEALVGVRDRAIARMGILTSEAAVRFATKRAELDAWCAGLGAFGVEIKTRVDAMLGGPTT